MINNSGFNKENTTLVECKTIPIGFRLYKKRKDIKKWAIVFVGNKAAIEEI